MVHFLKTLFTCSLLFGLSLSNCSLKAQVPTDKLIGYYPFNGNANDESGNGFIGLVSGAKLYYNRFGTASKSYLFNGAGDHIILSNSFDVVPKTISLWFNTADADYRNSYGSVYQSDNPQLTNGNAGVSIKEIDGKKQLLMTISGVTDTANISTYSWYHAAMVVDSSHEVSFYVDGKLIGRKNAQNKLRSGNGVNYAIIGADRLASGNYFKGVIDDIRIYNKTLSTAEIKAIFSENSFTKGNYQPMVVYPNPSQGKISIDFGSGYSSVQEHSFRITNSIGQCLYSDQIKQKLINLDLTTRFSKGMYLIYTLDSDNRVRDIQKLVIQ